MIRLRDSVAIRASPEAVFAWLEVMPQEYKSWHPDHVSCQLLMGTMPQVGAEAECKEYLHGKLHSMRFRITRSQPPHRVDFHIPGLGEGSFRAVPSGDQTYFVAELGLGSTAPLIGPLVDAVLRIFFPGRLEAMRQHMQEEGLNLKHIIESGWAIA
jgi:hypothetical protein